MSVLVSAAGGPRHIGGWKAPTPHAEAFRAANAFGDGYGKTPQQKGFGIADAAGPEEFAPPVKDQSTVGSCVDNAVLECYEGNRRQLGLPQINYSRQFLYAAVRAKILNISLAEDSGSTVTDGMTALEMFGSVPEDEWPYEPAQEQMTKMPPEPLWEQAREHRLTRGYSLSDLPWALACLTFGKPIAFGMPIAQSFVDVCGDGEVPFPGPDERFLGGHALSAWFFDSKRKNKWGDVGLLKVLNHWSPSWGFNGWCWLPLRMIAEGLIVDMNTIHQETP